MKLKCSAARQNALTLLECIIVIATLAIILFAAYATIEMRSMPRARRVNCVCNLKQIGLAARMFANDHFNELPWQAPAAKGGALEPAAGGNVVSIFQVLTNELVTPKVLICPADQRRSRVNTFTQLAKSHISYFVALEARQENYNDVMTGDRNITGGPIANEIMSLPITNNAAGWDRNLHKFQGNIGLADGSVQQVTPTLLNTQLQKMVTKGMDTVHLLNP